MNKEKIMNYRMKHILIILRSAVFLILDRTPKNCVEDE